MVKFQITEEYKYFTPFTMYMEYILLNYNDFLKNHLKDENITTRDFLYLYTIFHNKNLSQKELADLMFVSEANIAKMIKKFEKYDLVIKKKDENNKSRNIISLTQKGEEIVNQLIKITAHWETKVANTDYITNMDMFKDLLYEISENSVDVE